MDYAGDDHAFYDGLGPYDVHALRAAYAGLLELKEETSEETIRTSLGEIPVINEKFVSVNDLKSVLKDNSWVNLTSSLPAQLKVKNYMFCSDEQAGEMAMCDRFDAGSSATEIVENLIKSYHVNYSIRNFPGERKVFSSWSNGGYIGQLFNTFFKIRQFNEELIYQYLFTAAASSSDEDRKAHQEKINDYVRAAQKGYNFLLGVLTTPDSPSFVNATTNSRFVKTTVVDYKLDENGNLVRGKDKRPVQEAKEIMVETKALENLASDREDDRLSIRGVEFDKIIAMIALTQESLGISRYYENSIRVPYTMIESLVMEIKIEESPILDLLKQLAKGEQKPTYESVVGMRMSLPIPFQMKTNEMLRQYAVISAVSSLDYQSSNPAMNPARSMRILGKRFPVEEKMPNFQFLTMAQGDLKYFPYASDAAHANDIIKTGDEMRRIKSTRLAESLVFQILNVLSPEKFFSFKETAPTLSQGDTIKELEKVRNAKSLQMKAAKMKEAHTSTLSELSLLKHLIDIKKVDHGETVVVEGISTVTIDHAQEIEKLETEMNIVKDEFKMFIHGISNAEIKKNNFTSDIQGKRELISAELIDALINQQVIGKFVQISNCANTNSDCAGLGTEYAKSTDEKMPIMLEMASLENQVFANNSPVFALAYQTLTPEILKAFSMPEEMIQILPRNTLENRESELKSNTALMSLLFYFSHPQENQ
jgi:hypothetical protein